MPHSIFAIEVCLPLDLGLQASLRQLVIEQGEHVGYQEKWRLYRRASSLVVAQIGRLERGCWDYFDDNARADRDYGMWVAGMTTEEGARTEPSGSGDPYRGAPRFMTLTMAFLLVNNSPTDLSIAALCTIPQPDLWKRDTFARILNGMGALSFASVASDVIYVIPGDAGWGLTPEDLSAPKFDYLRAIQ
jgi:hypothetical protein